MFSTSSIQRVAILVLGLGATLAQAEVVIIGNPAAATLTAEQVADIYSGKSQIATPLDQPESVPVRAEFYKKALGKDLPQVKAMWSRLIFTGKAQPPREVQDAASVKKAVAADPKAIGYIDKAAVDGTVKVLATLN